MIKPVYFFVDESGDSTFFNKKGDIIVGQNGCSPILILGFIKTENPSKIRKSLTFLREEISKDEYLASIPSISKTKIHFHAKDDCPEVREKVFKLIKTLDFKAQFIVARKRLDVFTKRHQRNENIFYNELVSHLFKNQLHKTNNSIYFSKRGTQTKQHHLQSAIQSAILNFESKHNTTVETHTKMHIQIPSEEPCLQLVDYLNWTLYRAYTKNDIRYFNYLKEKISFICDIYDFDKYPKNFYSKRNVFNLSKISPLDLVS